MADTTGLIPDLDPATPIAGDMAEFVDVSDTAHSAAGSTRRFDPVALINSLATPLILAGDGELLSHDSVQHIKIPVGTDGQVLTARPGAAQGSKIAWEDPAGGGGTPGGTVENAVQLRNATGDGFKAFDNATFDGISLRLDEGVFWANQGNGQTYLNRTTTINNEVRSPINLRHTTTQASFTNTFGVSFNFSAAHSGGAWACGEFAAIRDNADDHWALAWRTQTGVTQVERMRLTTFGLLGINTNNPQARLHVFETTLTRPTCILESNDGDPTNDILRSISTGNVRAVIRGNGDFSNTQGQTQAESFGASAAVGASGAVAVGNASSANSLNSIAIGQGASVTGDQGIAIGQGAVAVQNSFALGRLANAGQGSLGIGAQVDATGGDHVAIGYLANAGNSGTVAVGRGASCGTDNWGVAVGHSASAGDNGSVALGMQASVSNVGGAGNVGGIAIGAQASSTVKRAVMGSVGYPIDDLYVGSGVGGTADVTWHGSGAGGNVNISGDTGDVAVINSPGLTSPIYTTAARPAAAQAGRQIWNSTDNVPEWDSGTAWIRPGGGGPAGPINAVQRSDGAGAFVGDGNLTFDGTTLGVTGDISFGSNTIKTTDFDFEQSTAFGGLPVLKIANSGANSRTDFVTAPSGSSKIGAFAIFATSDIDVNYETCSLGYDSLTSSMSLTSFAGGTGVLRPLNLSMGGSNFSVIHISTDKLVGIGDSFTSPAGRLHAAENTATRPAGIFQSQDDSGSNGTLEIKDSAGNIRTRISNNETQWSAASSSNYLRHTAYSSVLGHLADFSFRKSATDVFGSASATRDSEALGQISFNGVDSTQNFDAGAVIKAVQNGSAGARVPTELQLYTFNDTASNAPQLILTSDGGSVFGQATGGSQGVGTVNCKGLYVDSLPIAGKDLPTTDPAIAGAYWIDTTADRVVKVSAG